MANISATFFLIPLKRVDSTHFSMISAIHLYNLCIICSAMNGLLRLGSVLHRASSQSSLSSHSTPFSATVRYAPLKNDSTILYLGILFYLSMDTPSNRRSVSCSREFSSGLREQVMNPSHNVAYRRESAWETPVFKLPSAYKYGSVSSLGPPP